MKCENAISIHKRGQPCKKSAMKLLMVLPLVAVALTGCASRYNQALQGAQAVPFDQQPAAYADYLKKGDITHSDYVRWMQDWEEAKDEKAALAMMSPQQRAEYRLKKESLELQRQQVAAQQAQAYAAGAALSQQAMSSANATLGNQQVVTAINNR